jgi:hypothetical protein
LVVIPARCRWRQAMMTHSMSGAYGWKLIEKHGSHIDSLIGVAPGGSGNTQAMSNIVSEIGDTVVVKARSR